jgi:hypothetical protein
LLRLRQRVKDLYTEEIISQLPDEAVTVALTREMDSTLSIQVGPLSVSYADM